MKKFFLILALCLSTLAAAGRVVVFDATEDYSTPLAVVSPYTISKDGVTLTFSNGMLTGTQFRLYKNQTLTICCETGLITGIDFYCTASGDAQYGPGCLTCNTGEYSYEDKFGSWTGESECVTFIAQTNQVRFTKIVVTVNDSGVTPPVIHPAGGTYYDPIEVSITCINPDATIYYTTDGSTPTTASSAYTEPFALSQNTTVKAVAAFDDEMSDVVSAEYVFADATPVQNVWESLTVPDGGTVRFTNSVITLIQNKNYLYVKDETGYALFYGNCGQTYNTGDIIPPGFVGTLTTFGCHRELTDLSGFKPATDNVPVEPEHITVDQVGENVWGHYVHLSNVRLVHEGGSSYLLLDTDGNVCPAYFGTLGTMPPGYMNGIYDIIGIVGSYMPKDQDCVYQILPIRLISYEPTPTLCDLSNVEDGTIITSELESQVIYQSGAYLYIRQEENCYGLVYGSPGQTYQPGDIIPPGWSAKKTTYNGEPEFASPLTGFQPASSNEPLEPKLGTPLDVDHWHWGHFIEMHNVYISDVNVNTFKITDENGYSCIGFNRFLYGTIHEGFYPLLRGIVGSYKSNQSGEVIYELYVTYLSTPPPPPIRCLNELYELSQGQQVEIQLIAIYQSGVNLFVKDLCDNYSLIYGNLGITVMNGDTIEGTAGWTIYGDSYELIPSDDWRIIGHGEPVEPYLIPIEELSQDMVYWYVAIDNAMPDESGEVIVDETGELIIYNKFGVEIIDTSQACPPDMNNDGEVNIADANALIDRILSGDTEGGSTMEPWCWINDGHYYYEGFVIVYRGHLELYPTRIIKHGGCRFGDINGDGEVNIADLNTLIDIILSF